MDSIQMLRLLNKTPAFNRAEIYHRTEFLCYKSAEEVIVTILDAGPDCDHGRYHVEAVSESGRKATGNPENDLEAALALVHWGDLDRT
jgi:hypothetical protein